MSSLLKNKSKSRLENLTLEDNRVLSCLNDITDEIPQSQKILSDNGEIINISYKNFKMDYRTVLGFGGNGTVYKVQHVSKFGYFFAIKQLKQDIVNSGHRRKLLNDFVYSQKSQTCGFIIKSYCVIRSSYEIFVVMDLMDISAYDLMKDHVISQNRIFPEATLHYILYALCVALNNLEHIRIFHRDVKPANVLLNKKGDVKICDFGISGQLNQNNLAQTNVATTIYAPPERVTEHSNSFSPKSDVWPIGISILELAQLQHPYEHVKDNDFQFACELVEKDPPLVKQEFFHYSEDLASIINSCLRKNACDRPSFADILMHNYSCYDIRKARTILSDFIKSYNLLNVIQ